MKEKGRRRDVRREGEGIRVGEGEGISEEEGKEKGCVKGRRRDV